MLPIKTLITILVMANTVKLKYVFIVKFQVAGILCPFESNFPPVPIWYGIIPYYGNVVFVLESIFACLDYWFSVQI